MTASKQDLLVGVIGGLALALVADRIGAVKRAFDPATQVRGGGVGGVGNFLQAQCVSGVAGGGGGSAEDVTW